MGMDPSKPDSPNPLAASFATSYSHVIAFMAVVEEGNFAKAGIRLGVDRSAVSRSVQRLETQLGTRLLRRTTRSISLTPEGQLLYDQCTPGVEHITRALEDIRELREGTPRGLLRICSTVGFGRKVVAPLLAGFHASYPEIEVELILDDGPTNFASDRIDVSFRNGRMADSQIVARHLAPMQMLLCAAPAYAAAHGLPATVEQLARHRCINFRFASGRIFEWEFRHDGQLQKVLPRATHTFNDADMVLQAVRDGLGIAQMAGYQVKDLLDAGQLVGCLREQVPDDRGHYLCYMSREHLPARIRVFVDHALARIKALDLRVV